MYSAWYGTMDRQLKEWKLRIEQLCSVSAPDYSEATRLVADIARSSEDPTLQAAAAQALPGLRHASDNGAERRTKEVARRRLGLIRDALHVLTVPRFGKRGVEPKHLTLEERHRQLLGLPLGRRLSGAEINQGYKRAAKTMHPDGGGNARQFHELCTARDALMKQR
jgi:hypothetical protein